MSTDEGATGTRCVLAQQVARSQSSRPLQWTPEELAELDAMAARLRARAAEIRAAESRCAS